MASAKKLPSGNWRIQVFVGKNADDGNNMKSFTAPTHWQAEKIAAEFIEEGRKEKQKFTVAQALDGYISPFALHDPRVRYSSPEPPAKSDDEFIVQMGYQQIRNHMTALLKAHDLYMTFHDLRHIYAPKR